MEQSVSVSEGIEGVCDDGEEVQPNNTRGCFTCVLAGNLFGYTKKWFIIFAEGRSPHLSPIYLIYPYTFSYHVVGFR